MKDCRKLTPGKLDTFWCSTVSDIFILMPYLVFDSFFEIDLHKYSSKEIMRRNLLLAIRTCGEIDGD